MACTGCGEDKKLIKAHIIPESFFIPLRGETGESPKLLSNIPGSYPKKIPIGVYDKTILCRTCEDVFAEYDNYAQELLLKNEDKHSSMYKDNKIVGWQVAEVDHSLLKGFFMSVLWRASVSSHSFYKNVNLEEHAARVKELVWNKEPGEADEFSCFLAKFTSHPFGRLTLDPHPEDWYGVGYYRFYLAGYVLSIKVDFKKTPEKFARFVVGGSEELVIFGRSASKAPENKVIKSIVKHTKSKA